MEFAETIVHLRRFDGGWLVFHITLSARQFRDEIREMDFRGMCNHERNKYLWRSISQEMAKGIYYPNLLGLINPICYLLLQRSTLFETPSDSLIINLPPD